MRGKITYFNDTTGIGTITNRDKRIFEFRKKVWHDFNKIPSRGMFVEFRANENGVIVDCRESIFQMLRVDCKITEKEFWDSLSDSELQDLAENKKDWLTSAHLESIEPNKPIQPTKSIDECFDLYFYEDIAQVYSYNHVINENSKSMEYFKMRRFLHKAKTQLMDIDHSIKSDTFVAIEQELTNMEHSYLKVAKRMKVDLKEAFKELFLPHQIDYLRYKKRLLLDSERLFHVESTQKRLKSYLNIAKPVSEKEKEKHEKTKNHFQELEQEKTSLSNSIEQLKKQISFFENRYQNEFIAIYKFEDEQKKLYEHLKEILDKLAYSFDELIWQKACGSGAVKKSFYKLNGESAYCAMNFLRFYLRPLSKAHLSDADDALRKYLIKYERENCVNIMWLTEYSESLERVKGMLLEINKEFLVNSFIRAIEAIRWLRTSKADLLIVDADIKSLTPVEFVERYQQLRPKSSRFVILGTTDDMEKIGKIVKRVEFVKKPFDKETLSGAVERVLEGKGS